MRFTNNDINKAKDNKKMVLKECHKKGFLLRPAWKTLHTLRFYKDNPRGFIKIGENLSSRLVNLPSSPFLID